MLEVMLVRHAVAFEHDGKRWPNDDLRPLSPEGIEKFRKTAAGLKAILEPPERVLTSPLVRARQTAQLLRDVAAWPEAQELDLLSSTESVAILKLLNTQPDGSVALVGHEPGLSMLAAMSLAGADHGVSIEMKKGSLLCMEFASAARPGGATLKGLLPARVIRELVG
jgi:phosphohistidine phosphatase